MKKEINIAGRRIFYRVIGTGKPVMLVHGFGETGEVWDRQVDFLKDKFQLIVPDLPGSNRSEMTGDMSIEGMAEIIKLILDKENPGNSGNKKIALIGHSMGGYITLAFADKYSNYLAAFGLFHSSGFADSEEKKITRRKGIDFMKQHGGFEFLKTSTPNLFSALSKEEFPELINEFIQSLESFSAEPLIAYYEAMMRRSEHTDVLKNASVPVLFIAGEYDNAIPLPDVLKQCYLPTTSYFHVLHRSGHMGMMEETDKANQALEQFLGDIFHPVNQ